MNSTNESSNVKVDDFIIMYNMYHDAGFTWGLAIWALCLNVVGFLGISLNLSIVWITYRTPSMHGTANINLAMGSFFEVLHQMGHWLFLVVTFSGRNFIPYALSVQICSIALWGLGSVALSITFTAMDRLLYVLFPMFTYMVKQKVYLGGIGFLCILCSSQNLWIFYKTANEIPASTMISGSIDEILSRNPGKDVYSYYSLVLNFITLGLYITLGLVLKFKPSIMNDTAASRIYKSILVLITVRLSGFFAMRIFRLFIATSIQPYILRWNISESMSLLLNISTASTGPILYTTSSEYRNAFLRQFKPVAKLFYALMGTSKTGPMGISVLHSSAINGGKPAPSRKQIVPTPVLAKNGR